MDFIQIAIIDIDGEAAEIVGELFNRYGHGGAVIETLAPNFDTVTVRTVIPHDDKHLLGKIEALLTLIGQALPNGLPQPELTPIGKSDWAESWKEHFHVVRIGQNFVIKPGWRDHSPGPDDIVIEIDPGLAFGSGLHPSSQLCLKLFEDISLSGKSLFDVGTGSGVLSIAASKLGATPIRAVDIDDVAVRVAKENFELNNLTAQIETGVGSAAANGGQQWEIVVANILAHILIDLMPDLAASIAPAGKLILSGLISDQETNVTAAAATHGLRIIERRIEEDWVALVTERM